MTHSKPPICVCDDIYGIAWDGCEPSSGYICNLKSLGKREPHYRLNGQEVDMSAAIRSACQILCEAKYPLITGLDALGTRAQALAVRIGLEIHAVMDVGFEQHRFGSAMALAREGAVTATLGEIYRSTGMVLVLGCDPGHTHPRILQALMRHRSADKLVAVGWHGNQDFGEGATTLPVSPEQFESAIIILEALCRPDTVRFREGCLPGSTSFSELKRLARQLLAAKHIVVLIGSANDSKSTEFSSLADSVCSLVKTLNRNVRAVAIELRCDSNALSAENVLTWSTGFSLAVDATRKSAQSFGPEYSSVNVLRRREVDAMMWFGLESDRLDLSDSRAEAHARQLPQIQFNADWISVPLAVGDRGPDLLQAGNLNVLDDDFTRLDELPFTVVPGGDAPGVRPVTDIREFLDQLLLEIRRNHQPV